MTAVALRYYCWKKNVSGAHYTCATNVRVCMCVWGDGVCPR